MKYSFLKLPVIFLLTCLISSKVLFAQDSVSLRMHLNTLCSKSFSGRGYVNDGMGKAADYIVNQFRSDSLQSFTKDYRQAFTYPVNTFTSVMDVKIDGRTLQPGVDYLVHAAASGYYKESMKVKIIDGLDFAEKVKKKDTVLIKDWEKWSKQLTKEKFAFVLQNIDTINSLMQWKGNKEFVKHLPKGVFFIPYHKKPIWTVSQAAMPATVIEFYDTNFVFKKNKISVAVDNKFLTKFEADNIAGFVPGKESTDSFIVITAHYDHLGKMGNRTMFPGASDNASGTSMMLELARYYAANPAKYTMVFIAFAGEEAGLLGSKYFTEHPLMDLGKIKFLINIDIMGDATSGISVVNGKTHETEYNILAGLNKAGIDGFSFKEVRQGGAAANSDHYFFTEKGVPAFFIFSMGGKGYYHDIWDKADKVTLQNIPQFGELVKRFIATF
ncbi:M20/M25/M40 family metallo-hydrolase [Taibaiella lutea]|uniref:M20/M25/M40 family metallo-hydrolase n=1 Tax=Taibaiella lutea TaxID=2608001 RepID=A0A5M6CI77_9BACT|nr:M20/M25/M40 family metallo-hydrolase [Taibaiella lutea]KAA5534767.1 M20/M25/M40 family metallo-hydrolase [Taibaiella lutea]